MVVWKYRIFKYKAYSTPFGCITHQKSHSINYFIVNKVRVIWKLLSQILTFTITFPNIQVWVTIDSAKTLASNCSYLKRWRWVNIVLDDTLSMRIYPFIDYILIITTIKEIQQKIDFAFFGVRHLGLIVTAVTINGFTPVQLCNYYDFMM